MTVEWWVAALAFLLLVAWVLVLLGTEWVARHFEQDLREFRGVEQDVRNDEDGEES